MTCSQLSRMRRAERDCSAVITDWVRVRPGALSDVQDVGHGAGYVARCGDVRQLDEPDPTGSIDVGQAGAEREPGLADASGSDQGDDGRLRESLADRVELLLPAEKPVESEREVAAAQILRAQIRMPTLVELQDAKGGELALEAIRPQIEQVAVGRAAHRSPRTPGSGGRARRRRCGPRR